MENSLLDQLGKERISSHYTQLCKAYLYPSITTLATSRVFLCDPVVNTSFTVQMVNVDLAVFDIDSRGEVSSIH